MKYVLTLEAYRKQSSLKISMEDVKSGLMTVVKQMLPTFDEKWVDSVEDQSVEDKGVKFELKIGKDTIHAFLRDTRSIYTDRDWEFYLNKKKIDSYDLRKHLEESLMSELERFLKYAFSYDFYAAYIDDGGQYRRAVANNQTIEDNFKKLSGSDKKKAIKELLKKFDKEDVYRVFK